MACKFTELHCKEVICIFDGRRLGFVSDVVIEIPEGRVLSIVVPAPIRFPQFGHRDEYLIPWECIKKIGPDIILVDIKPDQCRISRPRLGFPC
ncbi:MAG: YlmC/YmxH family sporulation protein [Oscillospiraceae bacterium]|nr:YlmC/YmxH family sporulation protein [Oscillospiraceae bacterium]